MAKKKNKKLLSPIFTVLILILVTCFISLILSILNISANQTFINNGKLETTIIFVKNIFSKEVLI